MLPIITRRRVLSALLGILLLALPATAGGVRGLGAPVRAHPAALYPAPGTPPVDKIDPGTPRHGIMGLARFWGKGVGT